MTLETFFEKFDLFADAPDAVARMRELVMQLAVQGRLVRQDLSDEPAEVLLERIGANRTKLLEGGYPNRDEASTQLRKQQAQALPDNLESLPIGWAWATLIQVSLLVVDCHNKTAPYVSSGIRLLRTTNVRNGRLNLLQPKFVSEQTYRRWSARCEPEPGDILITREAPMGEVCIVPEGMKICLGQRMMLIRLVPETIAPRFLLYSLRDPMLMDRVQDKPVGATVQHLRVGGVETLLFPLPPLAEQKRIVAKVDELMALCDRLEAQQQEREKRHAALARASPTRFAAAPAPANLNLIFHPSYTVSPADLRKAILTLAVQGKLVPQDPNDEPAEKLLERTLAERRKLKRTDATKVPLIPAGDGLGYDIPGSWLWQRLDDLSVFGPTNGFSPPAVDYETPVRSLTLSATTSGRFKGEHSKFITTEVPADSDLWLRDGDILVQRGNTIEYVGVAAVYRGEPNCFIYPDLMMKLRVSSTLDVGYVHLAMSHDASRDFLRARASGTSGSMPKINQTTLRSLPLPIPPLAEQRRIVAKVEQLMALVDALETQLAAGRATASKLLAALVAELTGTKSKGKVSKPTASGPSRRGRPRKA